MTVAFLVRWTLATGLAGLALGLAEGPLRPVGATLLLPGLALGIAQRAAAPARVPALWILFSGLAWIAGALLDDVLDLRPQGVGLWAVPTLVMALWQAPLLGSLWRAWLWPLASLAGAVALQVSAGSACAVVCAPLISSGVPWAATAGSYLAGFLAFGLVTGLALTVIVPAPAASTSHSAGGTDDDPPPPRIVT